MAKKHLYVGIGITLWTLTAIFTLLPSWPYLYYRLSPQTSTTLASTIASTIPAKGKNGTNKQDLPSDIRDLRSEISFPDVDPSLPIENGLIIDKIGVRGTIHEGDDWETILKQGIWRVPNFGTPTDDCHLKSENCQPIIFAAHRWGYLEWSSSFRKLNSFYNLPSLKTGDAITIVWDQRPFTYTVYATETGTKITDYDADLVLYTCQLWNSPVRFFVYAKRT